MIRDGLMRGMLIGLVAGLLVFGFGRLVGEPPVDRAIGFEAAMDEAKAKAQAAQGITHEDEPELVSRPVQAGIGLFTGVMVYCTAFGGLFALVFAAVHGRMTALGPRANAALLGALGFIAVYLVPDLKYPANPPAIGAPETIGYRTALYFTMLLVSLIAITGAAALRKRLTLRHGVWSAALWAGAAYVVAMIVAGAALPGINEVPDDFPATVLWRFRLASAGMQLILWTTLGLGFGWLTERAAVRRCVTPGIGRSQHAAPYRKSRVGT